MEGPTKVYVELDVYGCAHMVHGLPWAKDLFDNIEYVRKDVVMDMLLKEKEETSIGLNEWENGLENGRMEVANSLIDKINAL